MNNETLTKLEEVPSLIKGSKEYNEYKEALYIMNNDNDFINLQIKKNKVENEIGELLKHDKDNLVKELELKKELSLVLTNLNKLDVVINYKRKEDIFNEKIIDPINNILFSPFKELEDK